MAGLAGLFCEVIGPVTRRGFCEPWRSAVVSCPCGSAGNPCHGTSWGPARRIWRDTVEIQGHYRQRETILSTVSSNSMIDLSDAPTASDDAERDPVYAGLRLSAWLQIIAIGTLFVLLFWPNLRRLWSRPIHSTASPTGAMPSPSRLSGFITSTFTASNCLPRK